MSRYPYKTSSSTSIKELIPNFRSTGAIILGVAYGYTPALHGKDKLLELSETAVETISTIFDGNAWMVDLFPFSESRNLFQLIFSLTFFFLFKVRHMPAWFPGMNFKRKAKEWRKEVLEFANLPFEFVQRKLVNFN